MLARNGCKVVVLCALTAAAIAVGSAQTARSNSTNEALTFNGDGFRVAFRRRRAWGSSPAAPAVVYTSCREDLF
jgi:hypothetical protein